MHVALVHVDKNGESPIYHELAGGLGPGFDPGRSPLARFLVRMKRWGFSLPLLSYGYMASIFRNAGHTVSYHVNSAPEDADVAFLHSSLPGYRHEIEMGRRIRRNGRTKVGFVGLLAGFDSERFLEDGADFVIKGEAETAAYRIAQGEIPKGLVNDTTAFAEPDRLPFPSWDLFTDKRLRYFPALRVRPVFPMLASRSCPYTCNYCPYIAERNTWRGRSPENVVDEMSHLVERYGARGVLFRDPTFSLHRKRTEAIARLLIERKSRLRWACETRLDCLDPELLDLLYQAGLRSINVGIETLDDDIMKAAARKNISVEHQQKIVRHCDRLGINVTAFYILGWPQDTWETMRNTLAYAKQLNTNIATFTIYTPYPGTPLYERMKDQLTSTKWEDFDCFRLVYRHARFSADDVARFKERAYLSYFFRPRYIGRFLHRLIR